MKIIRFSRFLSCALGRHLYEYSGLYCLRDRRFIGAGEGGSRTRKTFSVANPFCSFLKLTVDSFFLEIILWFHAHLYTDKFCVIFCYTRITKCLFTCPTSNPDLSMVGKGRQMGDIN